METVENKKPGVGFAKGKGSEVQILLREGEKKRRLLPVRTLLGKIPNLAFALKSCFMMSPLTVSQYIDPYKIKFDIVIFDEASQIMPEDAVSCLYRAKQAVVMGDTQQLPPTSFFQRYSDDDGDLDDIEDLDSFLKEASIKFRPGTLDWHYRSRNEHLIAFSNNSFYGNRLITFPNSIEDENTGIDFVYLENAIYDRGKSKKNRDEASEVVKTYKKVKKEYPNKSIGIIAFSIAQENAIRDAFEMASIFIEESLEAENESVFIKNLETVQGDERDIIILSVGYGKDAQRRLSHYFGPLNHQQGYKRLNVAVTRSRIKTIVISSIKYTDLDLNKVKSDSIRHFKNYLNYAENKKLDIFNEEFEHLNFESSFEEVVYDALTNEGFDISTQVGCSGYRIDLAVKHPEKPGAYILGIECDGAKYHSSRYARDRDKVRQKILEDLGWNIHRIWSDEWLDDKASEINLIKDRVKECLEKTENEIPEVNKNHIEIEDIKRFGTIDVCECYDAYKEVDLATKEKKSNQLYLGESRHMVKEVLGVEAPLEKDLLIRRILNSYGIRRFGNKIKQHFDWVLERLSRDEQIFINGDTISDCEIEPLSEPRLSRENQRPFTLIPKEELAQVIIDILKSNFCMTRDSLIICIAHEIYGYGRTGAKIEAKVCGAIDYLVKLNFVKEDGDKIEITDNSNARISSSLMTYIENNEIETVDNLEIRDRLEAEEEEQHKDEVDEWSENKEDKDPNQNRISFVEKKRDKSFGQIIGDEKFIEILKSTALPLHLLGKVFLRRLREQLKGELQYQPSSSTFVETPDDYWAIKIQPDGQSLIINVRGKQEDFITTDIIKPKSSSSGYSYFVINNPIQIDPAIEIIRQASQSKD